MLEKNPSRRAIVNLLLALPFVPTLLGRPKPPAKEAEAIVEVNGWILKKSDLA
ncbi:hypothetical protein [Mesorhizobium sp. Root157]|uniref:hypothetical protein n=1 Tax=Mesorhizobium sp. Root157 TaxID=1736477 RepID=UPI000B1FDEF1|nr:hypothetical protein [Mesorhizobium sp. Root157]